MRKLSRSETPLDQNTGSLFLIDCKVGKTCNLITEVLIPISGLRMKKDKIKFERHSLDPTVRLQ